MKMVPKMVKQQLELQVQLARVQQRHGAAATNNDGDNASSSEEASAEVQNTKDTSNKVTAEGLAQAAQNKNHALQNDDTRAQNTANLLEPEAPQTTQNLTLYLTLLLSKVIKTMRTLQAQ